VAAAAAAAVEAVAEAVVGALQKEHWLLSTFGCSTDLPTTQR